MTIVDIRLKPETLAEYGLPDILYPTPFDAFSAALSGDGQWPFALMLYQLQMRGRDGNADWQGLECAMHRLACLMAPDDPRPSLAASGEDWWIEVGPVDLSEPVITIQRSKSLIGAISPAPEGRLRVSTYRPMDAKSASYIFNLGRRPHPDHGVCMRENNWEYALDCSAGNGNFYAFERGEAYLSYWEHGVGLMADRTIDHHWFAMRRLAARAPSLSVAELGVHYTYSD